MFLVRKLGGHSATADRVPVPVAQPESDSSAAILTPTPSPSASSSLQPVLDASQLISATQGFEALTVYPLDAKKTESSQPWHRRLSQWRMGTPSASEQTSTPSISHMDDIIALADEDNDHDLTLVSLRRLSYAEAATLGLSRPPVPCSTSPTLPSTLPDRAATTSVPACTTPQSLEESSTDTGVFSEVDDETKAGSSLSIRKRKIVDKFKKKV
ncbi:hypothetical protein NADFUDRAFT_39778 [Nadsonia fulvescens var. elongata DSM 6958]|uniref:Uncharacterized protein n=1 Tax=Nadsonia fulvescens var. elongata DSM 6958 TaxID=857566 RepID=A0A1E3PSY2_9ASCO|nr:hypothetical protein NADFUDRAFT_39778 [Nadsonia fulvescens var. elongata DSM 6958]